MRKFGGQGKGGEVWMSEPVTGDLSSLVRVSFFTSLLNTEEVNKHALRTAATASCFSAENVRDIYKLRPARGVVPVRKLQQARARPLA